MRLSDFGFVRLAEEGQFFVVIERFFSIAADHAGHVELIVVLAKAKFLRLCFAGFRFASLRTFSLNAVLLSFRIFCFFVSHFVSPVCLTHLVGALHISIFGAVQNILSSKINPTRKCCNFYLILTGS
jgi:hypothetical protein